MSEEIKLPNLSGNTYKDWHKPASHYRAKKRELSDTWWPKIHKTPSGKVDLTFTNEDGQQMTFFLTAETFEHLKSQLIRNQLI